MPTVYNNKTNKYIVRLSGNNGQGSSTSNRCYRWSTNHENTATEFLTYTDSATDGAFFTVLKDCWVECRANFGFTVTRPGGWAKNVNPTTTSISTTLNTTNLFSYIDTSPTEQCEVTAFTKLIVGDVLRFQHDGGNTVSNATAWTLQIVVRGA
jgi:hypothetical protein